MKAAGGDGECNSQICSLMDWLRRRHELHVCEVVWWCGGGCGSTGPLRPSVKRCSEAHGSVSGRTWHCCATAVILSPFLTAECEMFFTLPCGALDFVDWLPLLLAQVREVLEGYLDDDQDMKDMNLTAKEQHELQQQAEAQVRQPLAVVFVFVRPRQVPGLLHNGRIRHAA